jgi:hypothetical protein
LWSIVLTVVIDRFGVDPSGIILTVVVIQSFGCRGRHSTALVVIRLLCSLFARFGQFFDRCCQSFDRCGQSLRWLGYSCAVAAAQTLRNRRCARLHSRFEVLGTLAAAAQQLLEE